MIPRELYRLLQCPTCGSRDLYVTDAAVHCSVCRTDYPRRDGYLDLMPRGAAFAYVSKYVAEEAHMAEELDYREIAPPLLAAGVRQRVLRRMLRFTPQDVVLDNGCGNGRFAVWNADAVALMVGSDPATLYGDAALQSVALAQADSRRLPFADASFDKVLSVDVLEHFPLEVIDAYLAESARVLRPGGCLAAFSNTRERSQLQPLIDASRRLGQWFVRRGVYDFEREARRKSDHVKALTTFEEVAAALERAGLRVVEVRFWNTVITSFVEHVLMKLGEALLARGAVGRQTGRGDDRQASGRRQSAGTQREIVARQRLRRRLTPRSPVYWALVALTRLMELDVRLFGRLRSGPYFVLAEKPRAPEEHAPS
ncbi:class I SAM-dependent methyltransferase [Kallotenue papyrolyticum]|uniref:class I SAM-dependent methyltransferase n=1 Tax=Kallotenue papyrolyticum TaxID=1325125 RepID=UPI000471874E|nr:class I SAM-dependent methyltransferase [Kallotenue papyrolyticum]